MAVDKPPGNKPDATPETGTASSAGGRPEQPQPSRAEPSRPEPSPAALAAKLVRQALKAALGSLDRTTGHPYASLVTVATEPDGTPLLLISRLALHTRNLEADPRASLMIDGTARDGDPMAAGRVTLIGRCIPAASATAPRRFLARHPSAAVYAGFADFRFYAFEVERAHFIGGFGRIVDLEPASILTAKPPSSGLADSEAGIIAKLNSDHVADLGRIAAMFGGESDPAGKDTTAEWRITGLDATGLDLVGPGCALRVPFAGRVSTPEDAQKAVEQLARSAGEDTIQR